MQHVAALVPCCMSVSPEEVEAERSVYQCETCTVADALDGLDAENRHAWRIYQQVACRFAADVHCGDTVLARLTGDLETDDFVDLWERLRTLYELLQPAPDPPKG